MDPVVHQQRIDKPQPTLRCLLSPNSTLIVPNKVLLAVRSRFSLSIQSIKIYPLETTTPEQCQQHTTPPQGQLEDIQGLGRYCLKWVTYHLAFWEWKQHIKDTSAWFLCTFLYLLGHSRVQKNTYLSILCLLPPVKEIIQISVIKVHLTWYIYLKRRCQRQSH